MKYTIKFTLIILLIILCSCNSINKHNIIDKHFAKDCLLSFDSTELPNPIRNHRWYIANNNLIILDMQNTEYGGSIFNLSDIDSVRKFARIGKGPSEYISPGLVFMNDDNNEKIGVYELQRNKLDIYNKYLDVYKRYTFPLLLNDKSLPKAYSSIWQVSDSIYICVSYPPLFPEIDLINIYNNKTIASIDFEINPKSDTDSYTYWLEADYYNNKLVVAYNYIDRIEVYDVVNNDFKLSYIIGNDKTQAELVKTEKYEDMIIYYQDIVCDDQNIYALYSGKTERELYENTPNNRSIEIFNISTGAGESKCNTTKHFNKLAIDRAGKKLYFSDPTQLTNHIYWSLIN